MLSTRSSDKAKQSVVYHWLIGWSGLELTVLVPFYEYMICSRRHHPLQLEGFPRGIFLLFRISPCEIAFQDVKNRLSKPFRRQSLCKDSSLAVLAPFVAIL